MIATSFVAVLATPPISADAVIVNVSTVANVVGVPEIVPVAVSNSRPAGRVPEIEYVADEPASAINEDVMGFIAEPIASIVEVVESANPGLVIKIAVVTDAPAPAAFEARASAVY